LNVGWRRGLEVCCIGKSIGETCKRGVRGEGDSCMQRGGKNNLSGGDEFL